MTFLIGYDRPSSYRISIHLTNATFKRHDKYDVPLIVTKAKKQEVQNTFTGGYLLLSVTSPFRKGVHESIQII